ncbi:hypothetical protein EFS27_02835 [Leuconostoc mesenteroides]|uniref:hypothetical protein n=1 Tax=Leuconostoc mesenteroides TaxID=1245 RepID=UPI0021A35AE3|nr:hypothetical protein [Leuconostoc mesenteroides]MCT3038246.1 hypothetical protein [Leuconostoc mesenteroides]
MLSFQKTLATKINHFTENGPDSFLNHFTVTNVNNSFSKNEISGYDAFKDDFEKLITLLAETKSLLSIRT